MTDEPDKAELENRIEKLEATIEKMMPSRRDALKMGGAALVGGSLMAGTASAGTNQVGTIGSPSQPVDLESEDINNADTVTTQDLVVNGTATGPFGSDLQGCRVFLSSIQSLSGRDKVQFDSKVYDSGNNFDTSTHNFTCPETGIYFAHHHADFDNGGSNDTRIVTIGSGTDDTPDDKGNSSSKDFGPSQFSVTTMNKYNQGDTIAAYAQNADSSDSLDGGTSSFKTFFEVVFLGSL